MPKVMTCDICGEPDADEDYEGTILCTYHRAEKILRSLKSQYQEKREWVRSTWFTELVKMRKEIARLEQAMVDNPPQIHNSVVK